MAMNELNKHKRSDKIKWIITAVTFVLVFVFLAGMCMQLWGKGKVQPSEWFNKTEQTTPATPDDENGGAIITDNEIVNNGVQIKSRKLERSEYSAINIPENAESSFELTATVYPEEASNKKIDWSCDWLVTTWGGINETWAKDKNIGDYYVVIPTFDGSFTAYAICYQAYALPIRITAQLRTDSKIKATCRADYVSKLEMEYNLPNYYVCKYDNYDKGHYIANWSIGTITGGTVTIEQIDMYFSDEFVNVSGGYVRERLGAYYSDDYNDYYYDPSLLGEGEENSGEFVQNWQQFLCLESGLTDAEQQRAKNIMFSAFYEKFGDSTMKDGVTYELRYTYTIDGQSYTVDDSVNADIIFSGLAVSATSISLNQSNIKH